MAYVLIPTIAQSPLLPFVLNAVLLDPATERVILTVNNSDYLDDVKLVHESYEFNPKIEVIDLSHLGLSIYYGWRYGLAVAKHDGKYLALLNDDIEFTCSNPIQSAEDVFIDHTNLAILGYNYGGAAAGQPYFSPVWGSYRHGGVSGAAFMVDPRRCASPNPKYTHWMGDDDMFINTSKLGFSVAIANYLTYTHVSETTARLHPWTFDARHKDIELWREEYGPNSF